MTSNSDKRIGWKKLLLSLFLILVLWAAQEYFDIDLLNPPAAIESEPTGEIRVLFTAPVYPDEGVHRGGIDERLAEAIDGATRTVDIAAFDLDLETVTEALIRAYGRGVRVRLVTDTDYEDELGPERLREAGVPVVADERGAFMHNKFVVIDGAQVWTGSWNLTDNGTYRNNNNVLVIDSQRLAENYTTEFEEMFIAQEFGTTSPENTPHPRLEIGEVLVETYFESEGNVRERIIELVDDAESNVYFMSFAFTDDDIAQAMVQRHRAGLEVRGVIEARNVKGTGSDFEAMEQAGVGVLADGHPYVMHHKVIIIDEEIVVTGSYNFSASAAESNDENVLIVHSPEIAAQYMAEFQRVYRQAKAAEEAE